MKSKVSAVILTKNESSNIEKCIAALKFCEEVLVVDDNSTDDTVRLAQKFGAKVVVRDLDKNYAAQNNFALMEAKNPWVFFVDADEFVSPELASEIVSAIKDSTFQSYRLKRLDYVWGRKLNYGEVGNFSAIRLVRKDSGKWMRRVHQYFETDGDVGKLKNPLLHYPHQNLTEFVRSVDRWSSWHALANSEEGKKSNLFKIICYPVGHFVKNYIFKSGFRDGMQGFVFAAVMAFHSYLSWSKLFLTQRSD